MDESAKERLFEVLHGLKQKGISAIYISHRLDEVFEVTDRITVLRDGSKVGTVRTKDTHTNQVVRMMLGRTLEQQFPSRVPKIGDMVLRVQNLTRRPFFTDVSFELRQGEILGIFGAVGSGKTELLRCIYGADTYEEGSIAHGTGSLQANSPHEAIRKVKRGKKIAIGGNMTATTQARPLYVPRTTIPWNQSGIPNLRKIMVS
jgi:ribose transport system ATP-binding protein